MDLSHLKSALLFCTSCLLAVALYGQQYDRSKGFRPVTEKPDNGALLDHVKLMYDETAYDESLSRSQNTLLKSYYKKRSEACTVLLESNDVIVSGELFNYLNGLFRKLLAANPDINQSSRLVIYRNLRFNAFTMGDDIVFIHAGLLNKLYTEEELIFVIAHELAHNNLDHFQQNIINRVKFETNDTIKQQIQRASRQTYGNVTALNELLAPAIFANKEQSRRNEYAADSLGIVFYRNAGYDPAQAMGVFDAMAEAAGRKDQDAIDLVALFDLRESDPLYLKALSYRKSNSLGIFEKDDEMEPYLRSHPYGYERLTAALRITGLTEEQTYSDRDSVFMSYRYLSDGEMVHKCIRDGLLSLGFHYSAQMYERFPGDQYARNSLGLILTKLSWLKDRRTAGKYIDAQSPDFEESYDRTVFFLQSLIPSEAQLLSERIMKSLAIGEEEAELMNRVTKVIWSFQHGEYAEYELRLDLIRELLRGTIYEPFLLEVDQYYLTSGKKKITRKQNK